MGPHFGGQIVRAGAPIATASAAMILVHGRNAAPVNILSLLPRIDRPQFTCLAPAAAGGTWYPLSFMAPREQNEPGISSALLMLESLVMDLLARGFPSHKIALLGFSQGGCLLSEFVLRRPRQYGGVLVLSGGLIGAPGTTWDDATTSLDGTPIFLGCSDTDSHVPASRVLESESVFRRLDADVTRTLYPGMGHLVSDAEIAVVQAILDGVLAAPR
ncbi:MAG: phospholipase [bacterium]